jgi:hypothetical protein
MRSLVIRENWERLYPGTSTAVKPLRQIAKTHERLEISL